MTPSPSVGSALPLLAAQREIWFAEQQCATPNRVYHTGEYLVIDGPVDPVVFEAALRQVIGEVEAVHVRFVETDDGPRQVLEPTHQWAMPMIDVSDDPDPTVAAHAWMTADLSRPMDLARGPLFRYALIKLGPERFVWYQGYHHIVMDGYGCSLVAQRMAQVYTALATGQPRPEDTFGSLRDLLDSERAYRESEQFTQDQAYWVKRFADLPEPTRLVPRSSTTPEHLIQQITRLSPASMDELAASARRDRMPWFCIVIAAIGLYVHRVTGARDEILGFPVTARHGRLLKQTPGMVSNVLPLRLSLRPDMTLSELITHVAEQVCEVVRHQRYSGEDMHRDLGLSGTITTSFAPLINIASFDYDLHFAGYRVTAHNLSFGMVDDLSIVVWDRQDCRTPQSGWYAHPQVCTAEEITAHHHRFLTLLDTLPTTNPDIPISRIDLIIPRRARSTTSRPPRPHPPDTSSAALHGMADVVPDSGRGHARCGRMSRTMRNMSWWGSHLLDRGVEEDSWALSPAVVTRRELRSGLRELNRAFQNDGIGPNSTVMLKMAPGLNFLQVLFALWSCGAQVILVDFRIKAAEYEPLVSMVQPQYVVSSAHNCGPIIGLHNDTGFTVQRRSSGKPNETDVCLVQFSSGSTGKPKVIGRTAHSLLAELDRYATLDGMPGAGERLILLNSMVHSMGLLSVLHCLNVGTTLVLPPSIRPGDVLRLAANTEACAIFGVPAHFDLLTRAKNTHELPSVRLAVSGGERLPLKTFEDFSRRYRLPICPNYGMTEVGIIASGLTGVSRPPAVGLPAAGINVKVVDQELYVRMDHSPYLYADQAGQFTDGWLRTYDRCREDSSTGVLSILGRTDSLAIIGGIKVDLTEVEVALMQHPEVHEAVVTYDKIIEAFVACDASLDPDKLTAWCRNRLSPIKIPKRFLIVRELPRNPNGKLIRSRELVYTAVRG